MSKRFVVEARFPNGDLDVKRVGSEPFQTATENQLCRYWFNNHPGINTVSIPEVMQYFKDQGWHVRLKTW